jgi:ArsR family transcriptional regulator
MQTVIQKHELRITEHRHELQSTLLALRNVNNFIRHDIINNIYKSGEINVTDIYTKLRLEQSVVSQHLSALKSIGLIKPRRDGKKIYYSLVLDTVRYYTNFINDISKTDHAFIEKQKIDFGEINFVYEVLRVLSHNLRQRIITYILENNNRINVNVIYNNLKLQQSVTSQHLKLLRDIGLAVTKKEGKKIYYSIDTQKLKYIIKTIKKFVS